MLHKAAPVRAIVRWTKVPDSFPVEKALPRLADHEKLKAASYRFVRDRQAYCAAHILLRLTIHEVFGLQSYRLHYEATGKPTVFMSSGAEIHVSLSHCCGFAAAALCTERRIGVDIESLGRASALDELLPFALSDSERAEWTSLAECGQAMDIFVCRWTLKEAIVKATGQGLTVGFQTFSVNIHPSRLITPAPDATPAEDWQLRAVPIDGGCLSVAAHNALRQDVVFDVEQRAVTEDVTCCIRP